MNHQCPKCGRPIGRAQFIGFLRLFSITCPQCRSQLAIDGRGRNALWGSILASIAVAAIVGQASHSAAAATMVVIAGLAVGVLLSSHVGRIGVSPDDASRKGER